MTAWTSRHRAQGVGAALAAPAAMARLASVGLDPASATTGGYAFALSVAAVAFALLAAGLAFIASSRRRKAPGDPD